MINGTKIEAYPTGMQAPRNHNTRSSQLTLWRFWLSNVNKQRPRRKQKQETGTCCYLWFFAWQQPVDSANKHDNISQMLFPRSAKYLIDDLPRMPFSSIFTRWSKPSDLATPREADKCKEEILEQLHGHFQSRLPKCLPTHRRWKIGLFLGDVGAAITDSPKVSKSNV